MALTRPEADTITGCCTPSYVIPVKYQDDEAVFSIADGEMIAGNLKSNKARLVQAWMEIHKDELMTDWELAVNGQEIFKIDPSK